VENLLNIESNNHVFNEEKFINFQKLNRQILIDVSLNVEIGMNYLEIEELISKRFKESNIESSWHPVKVRIDADTLLQFSQKSNPEIKIKHDSIYFIDIGSVRDGLEGDVGETFLIGDNAEKKQLIKKCKKVFDETLVAWKKQGLSGPDLYNFAAQKSQSLGVELNLKMDGHRIGSFPHGVFFKGGLLDIDFPPAPNLWILEIQISCPKLNLGAFYEDLIV